MNQPDIDDYRWLISPEAEPWLRRAAEEHTSLTSLTKALRRELTAARTHLVLEQAKLRRRATVKFSRAAEMFFTPRLLEQCSDEITARYKASHFPAGGRSADLCCGIGGDLIALAERGEAVGCDLDAAAALLAKANCRAVGHSQANATVGDVAEFDLTEFTTWHIDPDRRPDGSRTTHVEAFQPDSETIDRLLATNNNAAIKLAPASEAPKHWRSEAELEWIGTRRECKQQVAWFGPLARYPGQRSATILAGSLEQGGWGQAQRSPQDLAHGIPRTVIGSGNETLEIATQVDRYIFEPHSAILAAGLSAAMAGEYQLSAIATGIAYLTGPEKIADTALAAFEVEDVLPLDMKRLKSYLRTRNIGRLEVKKRGLDIDPDSIRRQLKVAGDRQATLLLAPVERKGTAILARRMDDRTTG